MNFVIVLFICISVPGSISQPLSTVISEPAREHIMRWLDKPGSISQPLPRIISEPAREHIMRWVEKSAELLGEIMTVTLGYYQKNLPSLIKTINALMPSEPEISNQESEEKSPESLQGNPNPEEEITQPASCEGVECEGTVSDIMNPSKEKTPIQSTQMDSSVTSATNPRSDLLIWFTYGTELLRKMANLQKEV